MIAILLASEIERFLELTTISYLSRTDEETVDLLVDRDGPLASFCSKIRLAYALAIISPDERDDLEAVRQIRNAFAHTLRPISFKTEQVATLVNTLHTAKSWRAATTEEGREPNPLALALIGYVNANPERLKFVHACRKLSLLLLRAFRHRRKLSP